MRFFLLYPSQQLSIHALREESDIGVLRQCKKLSLAFYPRSPRGERRYIDFMSGEYIVFLSTLSARRATGDKKEVEPPPCLSIHALREESDVPEDNTCDTYKVPFYPRSPRGERLAAESVVRSRPLPFYPRSPRGERQGKFAAFDISLESFLSTLSARRATIVVHVVHGIDAKLSIHALREESDITRPQKSTTIYSFLSTLSARRATICQYVLRNFFDLSIHALREESDHKASGAGRSESTFYPRSPRGERPTRVANPRPGNKLSIHALREESDDYLFPSDQVFSLSIHALREESDGRALSWLH